VSRHADAGAAAVEVRATGGELALVVRDDGRGAAAARLAGTTGGGDGLRNMRARADERGGVCTVEAGRSGGTVLTWKVPI
jgi:signal transduction histidine kinase